MQQRHFTFSRLLHRVGSLWRANLDTHLRAWEINMMDWQILWLLQQEDVRYNQYMLASRLGIETSHLVRLLDRMEKRHLLERHPDPHDRRQKRIVITPDGLALFGEVENEIARLRETVLTEIPADTLESGIRLLERIVYNITQMTNGDQGIRPRP
jgi:MarR family transcriptional regulator for hemolysin